MRLRWQNTGRTEPPKSISKEEREARKAFRQVEAEKAMTDHEVAKQAFASNHEHLRAERIAREATVPQATKPKAKAKKLR